MKEIIVKINKTKRGFFEKIKLTDLQPDSLRKKMNKQTNKKLSTKSHPILKLQKPLDQTQEGRNQKENRIQP